MSTAGTMATEVLRPYWLQMEVMWFFRVLSRRRVMKRIEAKNLRLECVLSSTFSFIRLFLGTMEVPGEVGVIMYPGNERMPKAVFVLSFVDPYFPRATRLVLN